MTMPRNATLINIVEQKAFELKDGVTSIGRDPKCAISVSDPLLSRFHAEIHKLPNGRYKIKDSSSSYGTYVAGSKISECLLRDGDEIVVGTTCFRLQLNDTVSSDFAETSRIDLEAAEFYPSIDSIWRDGKQFLESYEDRDGPGRFFQPLPEELDISSIASPGSLLSVQIRFLDRDVGFHVHTLVRERQMEAEKEGLLLEFLAEEKERQELVLVCARGESIPYFRRRDERIVCRLPVNVELNKGKNIVTVATNISKSGVYLVPEHSIELKMLLLLTICFSDRREIAVRGRVVSIVPEGPQKGMGIEFIFSSAEERDKMAKQIAVLQTPQE